MNVEIYLCKTQRKNKLLFKPLYLKERLSLYLKRKFRMKSSLNSDELGMSMGSQVINSFMFLHFPIFPHKDLCYFYIRRKGREENRGEKGKY